MLERDAERPEPLQLEDVAQYMQDQGYLTEDEINEIINNKISNLRMDWWLPMIHFDLDKYYVRPEFYGHLKHVATVLKNHPNEKDRKSTRLNSSHVAISYAVFCLKKKKKDK